PVGTQREVSVGPRRRVLAALAGAAAAALLLTVLVPVARVLPERTVTTTETMARDLFGIWVWPFELLSLLLLASLVAAFAVSRMDGMASRMDGSVSRVDGPSSMDGTGETRP